MLRIYQQAAAQSRERTSKTVIPKVRYRVAVAFLLLGIALLFIGHLFARLGWHDAFRGTITGPVVTTSAVLGFLAFCLLKSAEVGKQLLPASTKRLSSRLPLFVRFLGPCYLLAAGLIASIFTYFSAYATDISWPVYLFFLFLFLLSCYLSFKICDVFERPDSFLISSLGAVSTLPKTASLVVSDYLLIASLGSSAKTYFYFPALSARLKRG